MGLNEKLKKFKIPCFRSNLYYDVVFSDTLENDLEHLRQFILNLVGANDKTKDKTNEKMKVRFG